MFSYLCKIMVEIVLCWSRDDGQGSRFIFQFIKKSRGITRRISSRLGTEIEILVQKLIKLPTKIKIGCLRSILSINSTQNHLKQRILLSHLPNKSNLHKNTKTPTIPTQSLKKSPRFASYFMSLCYMLT